MKENKELVLGDVSNKRYTHNYYGPWLEQNEDGEWFISNERNMILNMTQGKVDLAAGEENEYKETS